MAVEEGHVLNIDGAISGGGGGNGAPSSSSSANKYRPVSTSDGGRDPLFMPDGDEGGGDGVGGACGVTIRAPPSENDRVSILSGGSGRSKTTSQLEANAKPLPWYKGITFKDVKDITPTLLILLVGLLIMIFVIPYAFDSVFKQMAEEERMLEMKAAEEAAEANATKLAEEAAAAAAGAGGGGEDDTPHYEHDE